MRNRNYALLFWGQLVSSTGTQMQIVAVAWQIFLLTHSAIALGLIGLFQAKIVFAIVASAVALFGVRLIEVMALFIATVIAGLAVLITVVYLPAVAVVALVNAWRYLRAIRASLLMAFSTTSSLATLPLMLDAAQRDLGISRPVASFVLPLGASIGRGGSALFQVVAVLFVARLYPLLRVCDLSDDTLERFADAILSDV